MSEAPFPLPRTHTHQSYENKHQPQTTSKQPQTTSKLPQTSTIHQQTTTNQQRTTTNYQQTTTNYQQTTTNDQINFFRIPIIYFFCKLETRQSLTDMNKHQRSTSLCNLIYTYLMQLMT